MFLAWLDNPEERYDHYRRNGGDTTINSLLGRPLDAPVDGVADAQAVESTVPELVAFIRSLPFDYETESYYFVHAGVDLTLENWRETSDYQKVWIRKPFHEAENQTGKWIVFGHTPVYGLFHEPVGTENLWISDQKMGVDGGAVYGGFSMGCSWMIKELSMTMSFTIQVFLPQTTEEAGMDIFHCKTLCF